MAASEPTVADAAAVADRLSGAIRVLDLFRQQATGADLDKTLWRVGWYASAPCSKNSIPRSMPKSRLGLAGCDGKTGR